MDDVGPAFDLSVQPLQWIRAPDAMIEAAGKGWIDRDKAILEALTGVERAGANMILTYWATEVAPGGGCDPETVIHLARLCRLGESRGAHS